VESHKTPTGINPPLRDYQKEAVEHICKQHKVILGDEQGLGKTLTSLTSAIKLAGDKPRILVLAPKVALGTWAFEIEKWFGGRAMMYSGDTPKHERDKLWRKYQEEQPELLVATYAMIGELSKRRADWPFIICDEYHKAGLSNRKSGTFKKFKKLHCRFLLLLSGTPVRKAPDDLFAPLHLVSPSKFPSYWDFVNNHCIAIHDGYGYKVEPRPRRPSEFKQIIAPYVVRRTKKKVLTELPPLQRQPVHISLEGKQKKYYDQLAKDDMLQVNDDKVVACPNKATTVLRLRQLLVTPQIFGLPERGAAIDTLIELVQDSFDAGKPVAICTPFRPAVHIIADHLKPLTQRIYKIHGEMELPAAQVARSFQNDKTPERALIFTISSGMSFDAYASSNIFFVGAEWSATANAQAESRIHRLGQTEPANAYYLLFPGTIDDAVLERLDENTFARNWVLDTDYMVELLNARLER